jgi:uncharacterized protein YqjF (DUF2071 family)
MFQNWRRLLFLHWEWDAVELQRTLPPGLFVDRHEGRAYLGVVPFEMRDVRPRFLPTVPGLSNFLELNLRTYVHDAAGMPGVWFYSLDANQRVAVALARALFSLPYYRATMRSAGPEADGVTWFSSVRRGSPPGDACFRYRATGEPRRAAAGSLEYFLLERYVLFAATSRGMRAGRVHHVPYPYCDVELLEWSEALFGLNGFEPPGRAPDHAVMSSGVDVSIYGLERID